MRRVIARYFGAQRNEIRRVIAAGEADLPQCSSTLRYAALVPADGDLGSGTVAGRGNVAHVASDHLRVGDVILCDPIRQSASVLFREGDQHHSLFLTNRCNSYCLMCSQPPTPQPDGWLVEQALEVIRHIRISPPSMGFTGGEPTLLGLELAKVATALREAHADTCIEVLTNARLLGNQDFADPLLMRMPRGVAWLVPLYGHADFLHDFVVQAPGAFDETIGGLLNLRRHEQPIQIRVVLIRPVLQNLEDLCGFIGRNLPFVHEVALMSCEPVGFALANPEHCQIDLTEWARELEQAARVLGRHRVRFCFMNAPLCALPVSLRPYARRSISDWKNVFAPQCGGCSERSECCGLFAWHERSWTPAPIIPIEPISV